MYVLGLFEGSFGLFKCIFGSIWPIFTRNRRKIPILNAFLKNIIKSQNVDKSSS